MSNYDSCTKDSYRDMNGVHHRNKEARGQHGQGWGKEEPPRGGTV